MRKWEIHFPLQQHGWALHLESITLIEVSQTEKTNTTPVSLNIYEFINVYESLLDFSLCTSQCLKAFYFEHSTALPSEKKD